MIEEEAHQKRSYIICYSFNLQYEREMLFNNHIQRTIA